MPYGQVEFPIGPARRVDAANLSMWHETRGAIFEARAGDPEDLNSWEARRAVTLSRLRKALGLDILERAQKRDAGGRATGLLERDPISIEKVLFDTFPGVQATAHLYRPASASKPMPAVVVAVGHWIENGKADTIFQELAIRLAMGGFAALVYDPLDQGERHVGWLTHGDPSPRLAGVSQDGLMVWESIRAIDFLASRPDVDATRIGITGTSGGGANAIHTAAVDQRVSAVVPVCCLTTTASSLVGSRSYTSSGGIDQCGRLAGLADGTRPADICGLAAKRPLLIISGTLDPFPDIAGARELAGQVAALYEMAGAADRFAFLAAEGGHGYDAQMQQAAVAWLARWLGPTEPVSGPVPRSLPVPFPTTYTRSRADAGPVQDWSSRETDLLCLRGATDPMPAIRRHVLGTLPPATHRPARTNGVAALRRVVGADPPIPNLPVTVSFRARRPGYSVERLLIPSEVGVGISAVLALPNDWGRPVPVVVRVDDGGLAGLAHAPWAQQLLEQSIGVCALEVRGTGETVCDEVEVPMKAWQFERDLVAQRSWDVRRMLDVLSERRSVGVQIDKQRIGLWGSGVAAVYALFAASLDSRTTAVACELPVLSFHELFDRPMDYPPVLFTFGVLRELDIDDLVRGLSPRPVLVNRLGDPDGTEVCDWLTTNL